jgi:hypothetical protein
MPHVLRVFGLFCLLAPLWAVQAQTKPNASLIAVQVEQKVTDQPATGTESSPDAPVTIESDPRPAPVAAPPTVAAAPAAEMVTVKGRVLDEVNKPLAGVVVFAKDVAAIASTDAKGEYSLQVPAGVNTLTFSYAGYNERQLRASNFLPTTVQLLPAVNKKKSARSLRR